MKRKPAFAIISLFSIFTFLCIGYHFKQYYFKNHAHPYCKKKIPFKKKNSVAANYQGGYTPYQIKKAYGIDKIPSTGKGSKIAIIVAYGSATIEKDLNVFSNQFNLAKAKLQVAYPEGKPDHIDSDWVTETSLDTEWVHALAPDASILLVAAKSDSNDDLTGAIKYANNSGAQVISMSWGMSEFKEQTSYDYLFSNSNIVYTASAGDDGAGVNWPAASPNVLAVGGTTLPLDSAGNLIGKETAWSGSGGGISQYEMEPNYQKNFNISSNNHRVVPDVSFNADPATGVAIYSSQDGWDDIGGTSFSGPAWAAFMSLASNNHNNLLNGVHNELYKLAKGQLYSKCYRDIIIGANGPQQIDRAHRGYDAVTGLGSPLENNLYKELIAK